MNTLRPVRPRQVRMHLIDIQPRGIRRDQKTVTPSFKLHVGSLNLRDPVRKGEYFSIDNGAGSEVIVRNLLWLKPLTRPVWNPSC